MYGCPSWSKGCDSSSHGVSLVGSNPTPYMNARITQLVRVLVL